MLFKQARLGALSPYRLNHLEMNHTLNVKSTAMNISFRILALVALSALSATGLHAQTWGELLDKVIAGNNNTNNNQRSNDNRNNNKNGNNQVYNNRNNNSGNYNNGRGNNGGRLGAGLGNGEIVNGLKEALSISAKNAGARLNVTNGFFGNSLIKILMPPEAAKVETVLRQVGMGKLVDDAVLSMNRAAEDAAGKAAPIFIDAVTSMNIQDGLNILKGGNGAATEFLRQRTTPALTEAFRPVIQDALNKTGAPILWTSVFNTYNKLPITLQKVNPDLVAYTTERALNGLFVTIAAEEAKIRTNPAARVTSLLQKVFGR